MRDVVVFAIVFGALPFAFVRPFYGLLLFSWLAYMRAPDLAWGAAKSFRFSFIVAITMFVGWLIFDRRPFTKRDTRTVLMMLLAGAVTVSWVLAPVRSDIVNSKFVEFLKVIAIALFTVGQIDSKTRLKQMVYLMTFSLAFYGVKGGIWGIILSDAQIIRGPGGLLLDNNDFSLAMVMNIPFLFYLGLAETNRKLKRFFMAAVFLTVITIVLTGSRGGFLAMAAAFAGIVLKSRYKTLGISAAFLGGILFLIFIPQEYRDRISSIATAHKTDLSAIGRIRAWQVAWEMIKDNPFFGVGFNSFVGAYPIYDTGEEGSFQRVAHNSYFQIWAESGSFALLFFLGIMASSILLVRRLARINRVRDGPEWIKHYCNMIEVCFYGFIVGATFLNRAHFDYLYQLAAISSCFYVIGLREIRKGEQRKSGRRGPARVQVSTRDPFLAGSGVR